jgi:DNA-binding MarR family transcriptional regulator
MKQAREAREPRDPSDLLDNTAFLVMDIGRLFRVTFDARMASFGLSRSEWWLIAHLWFFEGLTQQELADLLDMTKGGLAKLIDRLETKGIVERRGQTQAGRATKRVFLTSSGKQLGFKVGNGALQLVKESEAPLDHTQVAQLHKLLRLVRKTLLQSPET